MTTGPAKQARRQHLLHKRDKGLINAAQHGHPRCNTARDLHAISSSLHGHLLPPAVPFLERHQRKANTRSGVFLSVCVGLLQQLGPVLRGKRSLRFGVRLSVFCPCCPFQQGLLLPASSWDVSAAFLSPTPAELHKRASNSVSQGEGRADAAVSAFCPLLGTLTQTPQATPTPLEAFPSPFPSHFPHLAACPCPFHEDATSTGGSSRAGPPSDAPERDGKELVAAPTPLLTPRFGHGARTPLGFAPGAAQQ